ncbi:hypothetical protein ACET3X_001549 [Alternaria dauci]|uniref:Uncharacterized protein n=1 Tax=Alternaria dauci TaxID=48095 RepID=A0ABR3UY40_9PLEO
MSRIACAWVDLGEDVAVANRWYEGTHIPAALAKTNSTARHAEKVEDGTFQEVAPIEGKLMTIYDVPVHQSAQELDALLCPALDKLPKEASIDTRVYSEQFKGHGAEWRGDVHDVQMWMVVLWQPTPGLHDEFLDWFTGEFITGMLKNSELLRTRVFKLEHVSKIQDQTHKQVDKASVYQYMTIWEFDSEELPWEVLVYLGSSEGWRHYVEGGCLNWQMGQFLEYQNLTDDINEHSGSDPLDKQLDEEVQKTP